jgi:hypothetical protein
MLRASPARASLITGLGLSSAYGCLIKTTFSSCIWWTPIDVYSAFWPPKSRAGSTSENTHVGICVNEIFLPSAPWSFRPLSFHSPSHPASQILRLAVSKFIICTCVFLWDAVRVFLSSLNYMECSDATLAWQHVFSPSGSFLVVI